MPKYFKPELKPGPVEKRWRCPGCGVDLASSFDGERVRIFHAGKEYAAVGGLYEEFEVECPSCGGRIVWSKKELEEV